MICARIDFQETIVCCLFQYLSNFETELNPPVCLEVNFTNVPKDMFL